MDESVLKYIEQVFYCGLTSSNLITMLPVRIYFLFKSCTYCLSNSKFSDDSHLGTFTMGEPTALTVSLRWN